MRITTLDYAILGLLLPGPKTAYGIRMVFESTAMGNYSSSPGSIYPATKKLRKLGLVNSENKVGGILEITARGKTALKDWLIQPITPTMVEKESQVLILKFAFMDHLVSRKEKEAFLGAFLEQSKTYSRSLEAYLKGDGAALPLHARLSVELGIATLKTQINWLRSTLQTVKNQA